MPRLHDQTLRHQFLLQTLLNTTNGITLAELASQLADQLGRGSLSQRTIRRDIDALRYSGYDIQQERLLHGVAYRAGPRMRAVPNLQINQLELLALHVGIELLAPLAGTTLWTSISSLREKLRQATGTNFRQHARSLRQSLVVLGRPTQPYARQKTILDRLDLAIRKRILTRIVYTTAGQRAPGERLIAPLGILLAAGCLYVIAHKAANTLQTRIEALDPDLIRQYKVDRIRSVELTATRFQPPANMDLHTLYEASIHAYRGGQVQRFVIRFAPAVSAWVLDAPFHRAQTCQRLPTGELLVTIERAREDEIIGRVLSLADQAEVLEPLQTRQRIADILYALSLRYRTPSAPINRPLPETPPPQQAEPAPRADRERNLRRLVRSR